MNAQGKQARKIQRPTRPLYHPVEQETIRFYGHELVAVRLEDDRIAAVMRWLCDGLSLDPSGQIQRIERKTVLNEGLIDVVVETGGGEQTMPAITLDRLPGYLFTVDEHRVSDASRPDVILFQRECADTLAAHFAAKRQGAHERSVAPAATLAPEVATQVAQIAEQIGELEGIVTFLREHMAALLALPQQVEGLSSQIAEAILLLEGLGARQDATEGQLAAIDERTQRLTPAHARAVQEMVERMVRVTKNAPTPLSHTSVYGRLKHHFRANSYKEIPDDRFADVMGWLTDELQRAKNGDVPAQRQLF